MEVFAELGSVPRRVLDEFGKSDTLDIRVIAIFIIFISSLIGAVPPLYIKSFQDMKNPVARMLRAAGAGIVLCLALVHVAPYSYQQFGDLSDRAELDPPYNCAGATIVFGFFFMMIIEAGAHGLGGRNGHTRCHSTGGQIGNTKGPNSQEIPGDACTVSCEVADAAKDVDEDDLKLDVKGADDLEKWVRDEKKRQVAAHLFELGCAVHSVIIGISLGVNTSDRGLARNYFIALVFHQLVEAVALGSFIAIARLHPVKSWAFVIVYSLTVSVGIAIGIGVADSYNPDSIAALATQGTLNGLSVGILLYMAAVQMVSVDFSIESLYLIEDPKYRYGCFVSFFIFAGIMTFIAIWA